MKLVDHFSIEIVGMGAPARLVLNYGFPIYESVMELAILFKTRKIIKIT